MMTSDLKPYSAYKDSGVEWLGEVPTHWEVQRADRRLSVVKHPVDLNEISDQQVVHYSIPNVQQVGGGVIESGLSIDSAKTLVDRILLLVSKLNPRKGTIALAVPDRELTTLASSEFVAMEPKCCLGEFARYLYESEHVRLELSSRVDSATKSHQRCSPEDISKLPVPWPPLPEQTAIVRFLDHADRRIRRYIRAKQKLIALLEEQKQAIIHQAVTGQIDLRTGQPYPAYKDSGVEWLGDVPKHWEVAALGHRYSQCLGKMLDSKRITGSHLLPYLRNTDVQWDRINIENLPTMDIFPSEYDRYTVQHGDLLVCEGGEVGRCALWTDQLAICGFQKALHRLRPRNAEQDVSRFMYYVLRAAAKGHAFTDGHLSTIAHLTGDKLRTHRFPFSPIPEQNRIVRYLDRTTGDIEMTTNRVGRQIELSQEHRTRLIADVVTGKLDVREAAAELPEVDPLAEDDLGGTIHDEENSSLDELDAAEQVPA